MINLIEAIEFFEFDVKKIGFLKNKKIF